MSTTRKARRRRDPYRAREARRYDHPIPSRELIMEVLEAQRAPVSFDGLCGALGLEPGRDTEALAKRLRAMERDGQVIRNRRGDYGPLDKMDLVRGRVSAHRDGYGFLIPDEGGEDLYLSPRDMRALLHGDRAVARIAAVDRQGRRQGALVDVLERNTQRVVGRYFREAGIGFVRPDNRRLHQDIVVSAADAGPASHGQIVVVEILEQPTKSHPPVGKVVEVLGDHMDAGMEVDIAIRAHDIPEEWPRAVVRDARRFGDSIPSAARRGRVDLRDKALVTIDGADARDFDDAVYCERKAKGWKLWVAIADVGAYVAPGSSLDEEARRRGNSVYFPGRVVPMLPEALSNGLCSLNPHEDRLCMVCELYVGDDGKTTRSRFYEGVMRSRARLTYDEVAAAVVEGEEAARDRLAEVVAHLDELYALYGALRAARERRGAIELDSPETAIVFGPGRKIERIEPTVRNDAHRLIEECMIAANVAAARFIERHKIPALFRVHDRPAADKVEELRDFLAELGLRLAGGARPQPHHFAAMLRRAERRADRQLIQGVLLRSLAQAAYSPRNIGHFGLALESYAHFTSPIRRYPDLLVHRAIKHVLSGRRRERYGYDMQTMISLGEHSSMTERRADDATRDAIAWLKCEFMMDKVGEIFDGTVTAVTSFGLFVTLDEVFAEGLIHISVLGADYFHYDPTHHRLQGERTGRTHRLADRVRVRVVKVDLDERKIDLELVDAGAGRAGPRRRVRAKRRRRA